MRLGWCNHSDRGLVTGWGCRPLTAAAAGGQHADGSMTDNDLIARLYNRIT